MPRIIDDTTPPDSESPGLGDDQIRDFKKAVRDFFEIPNNTTITNPLGSVTAAGLRWLLWNAYTKAGLPAAGTAGRVARVSDDVRGLWMDQGSQWFALSGRVADITEFGAKDDNLTDNSTAIQEALDSGYPVWVPPTSSTFNYGTALALPTGGALLGAGAGAEGLGKASALKFTGAGSGITLNAGGVGAASQWAALLRGIDLRSGGAATNGILLHNVSDIQIIACALSGFIATPGGAAIRATSSATGGTAQVTLFHNNISNNSCALFLDTPAGGQNENWRVIFNRIAGHVATGGRTGTLDLEGAISSMLLLANDINTNSPGSEVWFGTQVLGLLAAANYINSAGAASAALTAFKFGSGPIRGVQLVANELYHSHATPTGRAVWFSAAGGTGVCIQHNDIERYAATANVAIDPGGFAFPESEFGPNAIVGALADYGTFGAGSGYTARNLKLEVIATANLPAAAAGQDGRVVIEDAGAGDRNLIVYAGGQRFRFDGGAPV